MNTPIYAYGFSLQVAFVVNILMLYETSANCYVWSLHKLLLNNISSYG